MSVINLDLVYDKYWVIDVGTSDNPYFLDPEFDSFKEAVDFIKKNPEVVSLSGTCDIVCFLPDCDLDLLESIPVKLVNGEVLIR